MRLDLDEYRRFRHRVGHIYGYELEAERVLALARGVKPIFTRVQKAVKVFGDWLEGCPQLSDEPTCWLAICRKLKPRRKAV